MFIAALFIIGKIWKHSRCPSTNESINTIWHVYIMEYYPATERNEVLVHATIWMNLENMPGERCQAQRNTYCVITLM